VYDIIELASEAINVSKVFIAIEVSKVSEVQSLRSEV
jgi:hypothetical protein